MLNSTKDTIPIGAKLRVGFHGAMAEHTGVLVRRQQAKVGARQRKVASVCKCEMVLSFVRGST